MLSSGQYKTLLQYKFRSIMLPIEDIFDAERAEYLINNNFLRVEDTNYRPCESSFLIHSVHDSWATITADGMDALAEYEDQEKKNLQQNKDKKKDRYLAIGVAVIAFFGGLITEYFGDIVRLIFPRP